MAKCLVVGANGFIGSHLVDDLARRGHEVTAFDRFSGGTVFYDSPGVRQIVGNVMNHGDLRDALDGQEFLFHFLSTTTPATAEDDPTLDIRTNISSSVELFELAVGAGVKRILYASTGGAIYGDQPGATFSESTPPLPVSPYAVGKLAIEGYLRYFQRKYGVTTVAFRISNPYGPRQRTDKRQGVIPIFLHRVLESEPLTVFGDGSMVRDYLYVEDVVRMIGATLETVPAHSVYNVGSGHGTSLRELIDIIREVTGQSPRIDVQPVPSTYVDKVVLDTHRYRGEFGVPPFVTLSEGISALWEQLLAETA